jgi:hypothetical protein
MAQLNRWMAGPRAMRLRGPEQEAAQDVATAQSGWELPPDLGHLRPGS